MSELEEFYNVLLKDYYSGTVNAVMGGSAADVTWERIQEVVAFHADSPEGFGSMDIVAVVKLTDGSYASCMAWCDTTGWDCRSGVEWFWAPSLYWITYNGLDKSARKKLGINFDAQGNVITNEASKM